MTYEIGKPTDIPPRTQNHNKGGYSKWQPAIDAALALTNGKAIPVDTQETNVKAMRKLWASAAATAKRYGVRVALRTTVLYFQKAQS